MKRGAVIFHQNYKFQDGGIANKLLVVLSAEKNGCFLAVKTTSQQRRRPLKDGCHPSSIESVFVFNANLGGFKTTTWIILEPILIEASALAQRVNEGVAKALFSLNEIDARAVINCLKRCDEISPHHLEFLV